MHCDNWCYIQHVQQWSEPHINYTYKKIAVATIVAVCINNTLDLLGISMWDKSMFVRNFTAGSAIVYWCHQGASILRFFPHNLFLYNGLSTVHTVPPFVAWWDFFPHNLFLACFLISNGRANVQERPVCQHLIHSHSAMVNSITSGENHSPNPQPIVW